MAISADSSIAFHGGFNRLTRANTFVDPIWNAGTRSEGKAEMPLSTASNSSMQSYAMSLVRMNFFHAYLVHLVVKKIDNGA